MIGIETPVQKEEVMCGIGLGVIEMAKLESEGFDQWLQ